MPSGAGSTAPPSPHRTAGTIRSGTVRFSVSAFNTPARWRPLSAA